MKCRRHNYLRIPVITLWVLIFLYMAKWAVPDLFADMPPVDTPRQNLSALKKKKVDLENRMKKDLEEAKQNIPSGGGQDFRPKVQLLETMVEQKIATMDALANEAEKHLVNAEKATTVQEREEELKKYSQITEKLEVEIEPHGGKGISFHSPTFEVLENINDTVNNSQPYDMRSSSLNKAWEGEFGKEMGGGVFINEPARIPVSRDDISKAEYDPGTGRFILYEGDRKIFLPPMDPDMVATAVKCLYYGEQGRNEISISLNIDPVSLERFRGAIHKGSYNYESVIFGCRDLWDTKMGLILLDSDDLVSAVWNGKNRDGRDLTKDYGFHSLNQLALDHPVIAAAINNVDVFKRTSDMRVWIAPNEITMELSGDRLEFGNISFRMFTETIKLDSQKYFRGALVPNPGADIFRYYFNDNFETRFAGLSLRTNESSGVPVRPFEELKEVARIVGVLKWIKGSDSRKAIPMDVSWAETFNVNNVLTPKEIRPIIIKDIESEIQKPITIYNQYGISRIIDDAGKTEKYEYDDNGRLKRIVRFEDGREEVILDAGETTAAPLSQGTGKNAGVKIILIAAVLTGILLIFRAGKKFKKG